MKRLSRFFLLVLLLTVKSVSAQNAAGPIQASDLLRIQQLGDVAVSPDGRYVAYTVRSIVEKEDEEGEYEYRSQLWLAGGRETPRQLTYAADGASGPAWHPDGDRLAFVRPVDGTPQIFVMSMFGGEPVQITDAESGASDPSWSPDGAQLLFASTLPERHLRERYGDPPWPPARPGRTTNAAADAEAQPDGGLPQIRAWLAENEHREAPRVIDRLDFQGEQGLESAPSYRHFFVVAEDTLGRWSDPRSITPIWGTFFSADWHPDASRVLLDGAEFGAAHPDRHTSTEIYITYVDQPRPRRLLSMENMVLGSPVVSPDGQTVAFTARDRRDPGFMISHAGVFSLDDPSDARLLTIDLDRSVSQLRWSPDNWHLYFVAPSEGDFPLYRVRVFDEPDVATDTLEVDLEPVEEATRPQIERVTAAGRGVRSFDLTTATIYYVLTRPENPFELYATSAPFERDRRLTEHNNSWLASRRISLPEHASIRRDTLTIDYWVMRPVPFDEDQQYPMLLQIHGGPSAMWGPGEASMWHEFQFFASRGYVVVFSNPRGSGGYGYDFQRSNFQDWGTGPAGDVLAVADAAAELPFVDPDRQVVTGGSYAGYLTAWIAAHDNRFRAAVAQRGVYDLPTFLGEGNAWRLVPSHFGGFPWEDDASVPPPVDEPWRPALIRADPGEDAAPEVRLPEPVDTTSSSVAADTLGSPADEPVETPLEMSFREILLRNSPLSYVMQINTPLLIIHGDEDLRTGVIQSEMLYRSLKLLDRPVEYVRYPRSGHELSRSGEPRLRLDRILRIYEFMERWI